MNTANLRWRHRHALATARRPFVALRHRGISHEDCFIAEYPRAGSTWLRFMLGEVIWGRELDFASVPEVIPPVGRHRGAPRVGENTRRLIKTHEPWQPRYRRGIYLVRHGADVAISMYHFLRWQGADVGTLKEFVEGFFIRPVNSYGLWQDHVRSWLEAPEIDLLAIRYEDLRADPATQISRALRFLGVDAPDAVVERAIRANTLDAMRKKEERVRSTLFRNRDPTGSFVRKGVVAEANIELDAETRLYIDVRAGDVLRRLGYSTEV